MMQPTSDPVAAVRKAWEKLKPDLVARTSSGNEKEFWETALQAPLHTALYQQLRRLTKQQRNDLVWSEKLLGDYIRGCNDLAKGDTPTGWRDAVLVCGPPC